jgi:hypothetical protein
MSSKITLIPNGVPVDDLRRRAAIGLTRDDLGFRPARRSSRTSPASDAEAQLLTLQTACGSTRGARWVTVRVCSRGRPDSKLCSRRRAWAPTGHVLGRCATTWRPSSRSATSRLPSRARRCRCPSSRRPRVACDRGRPDCGRCRPVLGTHRRPGVRFRRDSEAFYALPGGAVASVSNDARASGRAAGRGVDAGSMVRRYESLFLSPRSRASALLGTVVLAAEALARAAS